MVFGFVRGYFVDFKPTALHGHGKFVVVALRPIKRPACDRFMSKISLGVFMSMPNISIGVAVDLYYKPLSELRYDGNYNNYAERASSMVRATFSMHSFRSTVAGITSTVHNNSNNRKNIDYKYSFASKNTSNSFIFGIVFVLFLWPVHVFFPLIIFFFNKFFYLFYYNIYFFCVCYMIKFMMYSIK